MGDYLAMPNIEFSTTNASPLSMKIILDESRVPSQLEIDWPIGIEVPDDFKMIIDNTDFGLWHLLHNDEQLDVRDAKQTSRYQQVITDFNYFYRSPGNIEDQLRELAKLDYDAGTLEVNTAETNLLGMLQYHLTDLYDINDTNTSRDSFAIQELSRIILADLFTVADTQNQAAGVLEKYQLYFSAVTTEDTGIPNLVFPDPIKTKNATPFGLSSFTITVDDNLATDDPLIVATTYAIPPADMPVLDPVSEISTLTIGSERNVDGTYHIVKDVQPVEAYAKVELELQRARVFRNARRASLTAPSSPNTPNTCLLYTSPSPRD